MSDVINYILLGILLLCWFLIIVELIRNKFSPVKTVKAEVFDKYKSNVVSKYPENWKLKSCVIVFKNNAWSDYLCFCTVFYLAFCEKILWVFF